MAEKTLTWVVGIDEVGRGPIAGPVYVCGVAIPVSVYKRSRWVGLTDSKQLSQKVREKWEARARELEANGVIRIAIASQTAAQIDKKGISQCIRDCIALILQTFSVDPADTMVLLDGGLKAPPHYIHQQTIIRGDSKEKVISLASVVAKVTRDAYMVKMSKKYPGYGWEQNKGYGTKSHYKALKKLYITRLHRQSFLKNMLDK